MEFTDQTGQSVNKHNQHQILHSILVAFGYLISFTLLDLLTKQFEVFPGVVTWYPPVGLTYALLLVFGVRFTPAVTIAIFLSSVFIYRIPQPPLLLFLWSFGSSSIYAAAAWFLRHRIHLDWKLRKLRDVAWLVLTGLLVSAFLAILSVSSSALGSEIPRNEFLRAIFHWWIGEAVGVLTVTPFLLLYVMPWLKRFVDGQPVNVPKPFSFPGSTLTFIGQVASLVLILYWVFGTRVLDEFRPMYLLTLPLIWIAIEHGFKRLTVAILVLNFGVVFAQWLFGFDVARLAELELLMIVICIVGLLTGAVVTERKQVEQEIANLAVFPFENPNIILRLSRDGIVLFANPASDALLSMWGCTLGGLAPQFWRDLTSQVLASKKNETMDIECEGKFIELFIVPVTTPDYVNIYGRDITERKQAEEALRNSKEKYRLLFENNPHPMWVYDLKTLAFLTVNDAAIEKYGYTREEFLRMTIADIRPMKDVSRLMNEVARQRQTLQHAGEWHHRLKDGTIIEVEITSHTLRMDEHDAVLVVAHDITERKRAEEALRESEREFRILAEAMPQMVWITRPDGWNIYFNQQWVDYTGLTLEESYGQGWNKPFHPDDQQRAWDAWQNATKNLAVYSLECRLRRADGVYKWWLIRGVPVLDAEGTILKWFGTCTDIDELKQTENETKTQLDELQRWQAATLGRENRILELKHEVNELLAETNQVPRYPSAESPGEQE